MLKILLVDDSKSAQLKTFSIFSKYGKCDQAFNGRKAIDLYKAALEASAPYDLIVMDIVMPQMDGFAAVKEIRNIQKEKKIPDEKKAKIIMLTSKADPDCLMKAHFALGVTTYVTKPFADKTLIEAMSNLGLLDS